MCGYCSQQFPVFTLSHILWQKKSQIIFLNKVQIYDKYLDSVSNVIKQLEPGQGEAAPGTLQR